jgi:hypothetical protein
VTTDSAGSQSPSSLEERVLALEHRNAIIELTAHYNEAWDDGHIDDWVATFVPDGEFVQKGVPQTKGHAALRLMITAMQPAGLVHLTVDQRVTVSGDSARQQARVVLGHRSPRREPGTSTWLTAGSYDDTLALTADGWRFVSRAFRPDASLVDLPSWW